jgi:hypothetical protein
MSPNARYRRANTLLVSPARAPRRSVRRASPPETCEAVVSRDDRVIGCQSANTGTGPTVRYRYERGAGTAALVNGATTACSRQRLCSNRTTLRVSGTAASASSEAFRERGTRFRSCRTNFQVSRPSFRIGRRIVNCAEQRSRRSNFAKRRAKRVSLRAERVSRQAEGAYQHADNA